MNVVFIYIYIFKNWNHAIPQLLVDIAYTGHNILSLCTNLRKDKFKNSYQSWLLWITSSTALSSETFLDISDTYTHTVHHSLALCQRLLCPIILNTKNTQWWNIDFLSSFCSDFSWLPGKDSTLRRSVLDPALCSLVKKHIVSLYFHLM